MNGRVEQALDRPSPSRPRQMRWLETATWLTVRAWGFWVVSIPAVLGVCGLAQAPEEYGLHLKVLANCLQLLGVLVSFAALEGDARTFRRSLAEPAVRWWHARPGRRIIAAADGVVVVQTGAVGFAVTRAKSTATDMEGRLAWLEERFYGLQKQCDDLAAAHREGIDALKTSMKAEATEREKTVQELRDGLKDHAVGGLHNSLLGLAWVTLGTLLSLSVDLFY